MEIDFLGTKRWYLNNKIHRTDGPAVIFNDGTKIWYHYGKIHRTDGAAFIYPGGLEFWYLNDLNFTQAEWFQHLTPEQQENYLWNLNE